MSRTTRKQGGVPQGETTPRGEDSKTNEKDELLEFEDLRGAKEKAVQKWRQVGQTTGE